MGSSSPLPPIERSVNPERTWQTNSRSSTTVEIRKCSRQYPTTTSRFTIWATTCNIMRRCTRRHCGTPVWWYSMTTYCTTCLPRSCCGDVRTGPLNTENWNTATAVLSRNSVMRPSPPQKDVSWRQISSSTTRLTIAWSGPLGESSFTPDLSKDACDKSTRMPGYAGSSSSP